MGVEERFTEYHCGVAVIRDKAKLPQAMEKLAVYEDALILPQGKGVQLAVLMSPQMREDYADCRSQAGKQGPGKECSGCSLNVDVFGQGLCELPAVTERLREG